MNLFKRKKKNVTTVAKLDSFCQICHGPADLMQRLSPWPGTSYAPITFICMDHFTYLQNHMWTQQIVNGEKVWVDNGPASRGRCEQCDAVWGNCAHTALAAAMFRQQENSAVTIPLTTKGLDYIVKANMLLRGRTP